MRRLFERGFAVATLLLVIDAVMQVVLTGGDQSTIDSSVGFVEYQAVLSVVYVISAGLVGLRYRTFLRLVRRLWPVFLLVALSCLSVAWSVVPAVSLRRSIGLAGTTLFASFLAIYFRPSEIWRLLATVFLVAASLSLVFALLLPSLGVHPTGVHEGAWRGAFMHKNIMGKMMALGVITFTIALATGTYPRAWARIGWLLCALLVALSTSRSAWVVTIAVLLAYPLTRLARAGTLAVIPVLIGSILGGAGLGLWFSQNSDQLFSALGRDATLTGRVPLWGVALSYMPDRLLLGHGYRAFWFDEQGPAGQVWQLVGWMPTDGHNSLVDQMLELGIVGTVLLLGAFVMYVRNAVAVVRGTDPLLGRVLFALLAYVVWGSLSGTVIPSPNSIYWVVFVVGLAFAVRQRDADTGVDLRDHLNAYTSEADRQAG